MLVTVVVNSGLKGYTSQHRCTGWTDVVQTLVEAPSFREFCLSALPSTAAQPLTADEVSLFIPMEPLHQTWCAQGGRSGEYFTAICVKTAEPDESA